MSVNRVFSVEARAPWGRHACIRTSQDGHSREDPGVKKRQRQSNRIFEKLTFLKTSDNFFSKNPSFYKNEKSVILMEKIVVARDKIVRDM